MDKSSHYYRDVKVSTALCNAGSNMNVEHSVVQHVYRHTQSDFESVNEAVKKYGC